MVYSITEHACMNIFKSRIKGAEVKAIKQALIKIYLC